MRIDKLRPLQLVPATKESPEQVVYKSAKARCERRGIAFAYADLADFMRRVGRRPAGKFLSGAPMYSLRRRNDDGEYEWKPTSERKA